MAKKSKFSIKKLIYNDKYLIIISIILALIIWCVTSMSLSPETNKTITVPLAVDFTDSAATQLGIKCYGDDSIDVEVTVSCKKYLARDITADDINVYLQTNTVTSNGNLEVPIKVESGENADFKIVSFYPTVYRAYFDVEDEKVMDINVQYDNEDFIAEGYVKGENLLSESSVTVKGPKTYVSEVDRIVANVAFDEQISTTQTVALKLLPVNKNNQVLDYVTLSSKNENITLTVPVLKRTTLDVTSSFIGKPAGVDTTAFGINYSVASVNAGVLEEAGIKQANIGNIDFSKLTVGDNTFSFKTSSMESFTVLDDIDEITATVTVPDSYKTSTIYVNGKNVEITNVPDGYKAEVVSLSSYSVTAVGEEEGLNDLSTANVRLHADLSSLGDNIKEGVNTFNLTATLDNSDACWIYGDYTVSIRVYK